MTDEEREAAKRELAQICYELGCSGLSPDYCPGDPHCNVLRKIFAGNVVVTNPLIDYPSQPNLFDH